ncbi:hypothetical protein [Nonomuraea longicatena]|uniref:hypothetical protein n=1 Tax=Nonomuraea longicatena TaxID=83682 RepID=UPI0031D85BB4
MTITTHGPVRCLSVSGVGAPGGREHLGAVGALTAVAAELPVEPGPLEGQWWVEDDGRPPLEVPRELWRWHLLLPLAEGSQAEKGPGEGRAKESVVEGLEAGMVEAARERARASGAAVDRVRLAVVTPGRCAQVLHVGPFSEEHVSLAVLDAYLAEHDLVPNGPHHEVYLTAWDVPVPRTLLRQPVRERVG